MSRKHSSNALSSDLKSATSNLLRNLPPTKCLCTAPLECAYQRGQQEPVRFGASSQRILLLGLQLVLGKKLFDIIHTDIEAALFVVGFCFLILLVSTSPQPSHHHQQPPLPQYESATDSFEITTVACLLEYISVCAIRYLKRGKVLQWKVFHVYYHMTVCQWLGPAGYSIGLQYQTRESMQCQKPTIRPIEHGSGRNRKRRQSNKCCSKGASAKRHCSTPRYYHTSLTSSVGSGSGSNDGNEEDDWRSRRRPPRSAPPFLDREAQPGRMKSKPRKRDKTCAKSLRRRNSPKESYTLSTPHHVNAKQREWDVLENDQSQTHVKLPLGRGRRKGWKNWLLKSVVTSKDLAEGIAPKEPSPTAHPSPMPAISARKVHQPEIPTEIEKTIPRSTKPGISRLPGDAQEYLLQENGPPSPIVSGSDRIENCGDRSHSSALLAPGVSYADKVRSGIQQDGVDTLFNAPHPNLPVDPASQLVTEVSHIHLTSKATAGVRITYSLTLLQVLAVNQSHDTVADASTGDHLPSGDVSPPEIEALVTTGNGSLDQHQCSDAHSPARESIVVPPVRSQLIENDLEAVQMVTLKSPVPECMCPNNKTKVFLREYLLTQQRDKTAVLPGSAEQENTDHVQSLDASEARVELDKPVSVSEPTLSQSLCLVVNGNELCFVQTNQAQVEEDSIPYGDEPPQTSEGCLLPFAVPRSPLPLPDSHSDHQPIARVHIDNGNYFSFNCLTEVIVHDRINQADHGELHISVVLVSIS